MPDSKEIDLHFLHPTKSGLDHSVKLVQGPDGQYFGLVPVLQRGEWIIQIGTDVWRLNARATLNSDQVTVFFKPVPVG